MRNHEKKKEKKFSIVPEIIVDRIFCRKARGRAIHRPLFDFPSAFLEVV